MSTRTQTPSPTPHDWVWTLWHNVLLLVIALAMLPVGLLLPLSWSLWKWVSVLGLLLLFVTVAGHGITGLWYGVLLNGGHKLSLSRLQLVLWMLVVMSGFLTAAFINIRTGQPEPLAIAMAPELWLLMGINTASLVSAPILHRVNVVPSGTPGEAISPDRFRWYDLFHDRAAIDRPRLDLSRVQMFFFTLLLVLAYSAALATLFQKGEPRIDALPPLDPSMLFLLAISHAGYLSSKLLAASGQAPPPP